MQPPPGEQEVPPNTRRTLWKEATGICSRGRFKPSPPHHSSEQEEGKPRAENWEQGKESFVNLKRFCNPQILGLPPGSIIPVPDRQQWGGLPLQRALDDNQQEHYVWAFPEDSWMARPSQEDEFNSCSSSGTCTYFLVIKSNTGRLQMLCKYCQCSGRAPPSLWFVLHNPQVFHKH